MNPPHQTNGCSDIRMDLLARVPDRCLSDAFTGDHSSPRNQANPSTCRPADVPTPAAHSRPEPAPAPPPPDAPPRQGEPTGQPSPVRLDRGLPIGVLYSKHVSRVACLGDERLSLKGSLRLRLRVKRSRARTASQGAPEYRRPRASLWNRFAVRHSLRPVGAYDISFPADPGRCPGLSSVAPLGQRQTVLRPEGSRLVSPGRSPGNRCDQRDSKPQRGATSAIVAPRWGL